MNTFQLWEGLSGETLGKLITYQRDNYDLELELIAAAKLDLPSPFTEVEDEEEIEKLIKQKPHSLRKVK